MNSQTNSTSTDTEPKTKGDGFGEFSELSLDEMESEVSSLFPNHPHAKNNLMFCLMGDLPFRIFSTDNDDYWVSHKEQLIEWFANAVEDGSIHFHTGEKRK